MKAESPYDQFDLEQAVQACWSTKEDLELIYEEAMEEESSKDELANALLGLIRLHDLRSQRAFRILEELIHDGSLARKDR